MSAPSGIMVTVADVRACKYCHGGSRTWAAKHNLSWTEFVEKGIAVERFEALGDALGDAVAKIARERAARQ